MGWTYSTSWPTREVLLEYLRSDGRMGENYELVRSCAVGNNHWYVCRYKPDNTMHIGLDLMSGGGRQHGWGYKALDETMGPGELNCPVAYIKLVASFDQGGYSRAWRQLVLERAVERAARPAPARGQVIQYGETLYRLEEPAGPRKGWYVTSLVRKGDALYLAQAYRMRAKQLSQARFIDPSTLPPLEGWEEAA